MLATAVGVEDGWSQIAQSAVAVGATEVLLNEPASGMLPLLSALSEIC